MLQSPTHPAEADARRLYRRYLAGWAFDALRLRSAGLDLPSERGGEGLPIGPARDGRAASQAPFLADFRARKPRWIPSAKAA